MVVQQMVLGPDENHVDYLSLTNRDGTRLAEFTARKLRLTPPHFGMGCLVESTRDTELVREGRRVIDALGYWGMAGVNFKRDARDGRLYLFEVNPRFLVWIGLPIAAGVDFAWLYYRMARGDPTEGPGEYRLGRRWCNFGRDLDGLGTYLRDGTWTVPRWMASVSPPLTTAFFALDDPAPGIVGSVRLATRLMRRVFAIRRSSAGQAPRPTPTDQPTDA
jgi:predicted ATP-grasp superfamily ATP-dependent carboligase